MRACMPERVCVIIIISTPSCRQKRTLGTVPFDCRSLLLMVRFEGVIKLREIQSNEIKQCQQKKQHVLIKH